jgi:pyruvate kinase
MLESMVSSRLPTRAEATDVANAILDGTDCVMLSGESAMGRYPEEAVAMLAKIAASTEKHRPHARLKYLHDSINHHRAATAAEAIASVVEHALETAASCAVIVPTRSGTTARMISRFKPGPWIVSASRDERVCQALHFSYGVSPVHLAEEPEDWRAFAMEWVRKNSVRGTLAVLVAGPSQKNPTANHRIEFLRLGADAEPSKGQL